MINKIHKTKILFVEENRDVREMITIALKDTYDIYMASSIDQCLQKKMEHGIRIIFTDLRLGKETGSELCKMIRQLDQISIVCAMTENTPFVEFQNYRKIGFDDYLSKSITSDELIDFVETTKHKIERWIDIIIYDYKQTIDRRKVQKVALN